MRTDCFAERVQKDVILYLCQVVQTERSRGHPHVLHLLMSFLPVLGPDPGSLHQLVIGLILCILNMSLELPWNISNINLLVLILAIYHWLNLQQWKFKVHSRKNFLGLTQGSQTHFRRGPHQPRHYLQRARFNFRTV